MVSLKTAVTALAAWATLTQAAPVESYEGSSALSPRASYVTKSGLFFNIDGTAKYFAGTNSYWIGFFTNNADVDLVITHLQTSGIKVLRV
jgi:mannan endo-1,4-beta-mannosidase